MSLESYTNTSKLSKDLSELIAKENDLCDFEIKISETNENTEKIFKCHKAILSSRSDYFGALFRTKMKEYHESKVELNDISSESMELILNYIYTGIMNVNPENAIEILIASKNCFWMKKFSIFLLLLSAKIWQLITFLMFSKVSQNANFLKFTTREILCIIRNPGFLSFVPEIVLFETILKWTQKKLRFPINGSPDQIPKEQADLIQEKITRFIGDIRFCDMQKKEVEQIQSYNIIPEEIMKDIILFHKSPQERKSLFKKYKEKKLRTFAHRGNPFKKSLIIKDNISQTNYLRKWINDPFFFR
ncbi:hypothetical protein M0811_13525 [Anaeramoeba ignava]|uniref:BTB domain-containing protein n=1 Tax=Anaeramoeba ignava TaxID=1746090 RepID=A0A9Q0L689_ANAIG|nr:hypothetical protein M0811_13525 [Anaeramoeba ignava]